MTGSPEAIAAATRPDTEGESPASLRANRDFQWVLSGQAVSAFGDAVSLTAMPLLVLFLTGSGALMGIVGALQLLPDLVLGLPAGALADRWDRRRMMLWADTGRALLTALIPLSFWLGWPTMTVILLVALPINALRVLSDAGFTASIPRLVGRENLARANSYLEATLSVPFIIGPAIAGVLVATIGPATTIAINAASFAVSAVTLIFVRRSLRAERAGEMPRIISDIRDGIRFVWRHSVLRSVIAYWSVMAIVSAPLIPTLGYYITIDRGLGPEVFGFVGSTWSLGYLGGSLVAGRLGGGRVGLRMALGGVAIGVALAVIAVTGSAPLYLLAGALIGAALSIQLIGYMTLRATVTPDELMGRVGSTARTISLGLQPVGLLVGGALIDATNGGVTLLTMGGLAVAGSLLFASIRGFREAGHGETPPVPH